MRNFDTLRRNHVRACRSVLSKGLNETLSEAAFPAYSHSNPIISRLFWDRLRRAVAFLEASPDLQVILDFGCGGCPMAPFASRVARRVIAADIELGPARAIAEVLPLPENVELLDLQHHSLSTIPSESVDVVLALDVLEHVANLDDTLIQLHRLLKNGGRILVSGPTENLLYQIGRRLAGREYTGHYHKRNINQIRSAFVQRWVLNDLRDLYPGIPFFKLFVATRSS